ncbi:MAG TPA: hypothetical protein VKS21_04635 [Spirochaetota bacterium]|nr:hypothetical protein [Spirochaetota bacterium]
MEISIKTYLTAFVLIIFIAFLCAATHYYLLKRHTFGKIWGALLVALFGAASGSYIFDWLLIQIINILKWLMKDLNTKIMPPFNIPAAFAGSLLILYIYYKITPKNQD